MAFKIVNNEVVENGGNGVFDSVAVGINDGVALTPIEVLVHNGLGTATLQNVTIDGTTVIITGVGGLFTTDDITEGTSNLFYTDARAQAVSINSLFEDPSPMLSADLDAGDLSITSVLTIGFNTISANPIHAEGCLFYDNVNKSLSYFNDATDVTVNIGREQLIRVVNNTAGIIVNGSVCRISGSDGTVPEVSLSQADTIATSTVAGIATHDIGIGEYGYITVIGTVRGLSTSLYSAGDAIYLSDTLAGNWTTTPPTFPSYVVELGVVSKIDAANGEVEVRIHSHAFENLQVDGPADFEIGLSSHGNIDMLSNSIINVAAPANPNDAVNKNYVDVLVSGGLGALTTDDIAEATNLYYTAARARSAISVTGAGSYDSINGVIDIQGEVTSVNTQTGDVVLSSTEISEGTNLYYTDSRVDTRFDSRLALKSTTDLTEGLNLYYTDARARSAISVTGAGSYDSINGVIDIQGEVTSVNTQTGDVLLTTTEISEGTNLYYTDSRVDTRFDTRLALKSTTDLTEGLNLYYTDARSRSAISVTGTGSYDSINGIIDIQGGVTSVNTQTGDVVLSSTEISEGTNLYYTDTRFDNRLALKTTNNLTEGSNLYYTTARFDSRLALKTTTDLAEGTNLYYTTARFDTRFDSRLALKSTDNIAEGLNLYYTDARARSSISVTGTGSYDSINGVIDIQGGVTSVNTQTGDVLLTTTEISEGTNLYYTTARFDTRFDSRLALKSTTNLAEGSNLYYTDARFDSRLTLKTTTDLSEGSNLYYTDTRFDSRLALKSTTDLTEGTNLYYTSTRFDNDFVAKSTSDLSEGTNLYYTDTRFDNRLALKTTSNLTEGSNLYYTAARFDAALASKSTTNLAEGTNLYYTDTRFDTRLAAKSTTNLTEGSNLYYTTARANSAIDTRVNASFVNALNVTAAAVQPNSVTLGTGTTGNYVATITGTGGEIDVTGSGTETAAITLSLPTEMVVPQNLTVTGNLTVNGTTITNDTSTVAVNDPYITVGGSTPLSADDNKDRGVRFRWHDGAVDTTAGSFVTGHVYIITATGTTNFTLIGAADSNPGTVFTATGPGTGTGTANDEVNTHLGFFGFDDSDNSFFYIPDATETGETFAGTIGNAKFTTVTADLVGNVTGNTAGTHTGAVVGNASTATALQTARTFSLAGDVITASPVSFNGTGDIVLTTTIQPNSVALGTDTSGNYVSTITAGTGIVVSGSGVETAAVTVTHADTSTQASVNNSNGVVIQDITLDDFGHITAIGSLDLDTRYYTETEADARFVNTAGDAMTGALTLSADPTALLHAATKQYVDAQVTSGVVTSANKWTTSRLITLGGDATGSVSIDGSANVTLTVAVVDDSHNHIISNVDGLQTALDGKLDTTHDMTLTLSGDATGSATFTDMGNATLTVVIADDSHNHIISNVDGLQTALDGKLDTTHDMTLTLTGDATGSATFTDMGNATLTVVVADDSHNHIIGNVDGLQAALDGKLDITHDMILTLAGDATGTATFTDMGNATLTVAIADDSHNHIIGNVDGLQAALDGKLDITHDMILTLAGDATGSATFTDMGNATLTVVVADDSHTHDGRYYTETEADARFINTAGDTLTGFLTLNSDPTALLHAASKQYVDAQILSGTVTSAGKWTTARSISLGGDATGSVSIDGSSNVTLTVAVVDDSHTHDGRYYTETEADARFINTAGDTLTGFLTLNSDPTALLHAASKQYVDAQILSGVVTSAGKWTTARSISLGGDATGSVSIDGSSNVTLTVAVVDDSHTHDGRYYTETEADARFVNATGDTLTGFLTLNADPTALLHAATKQYVDAQVTSGVVTSANKWTTARSITLAGDATGSVSIDGSANVTLTVAVADDSHNHDGRYYTETESDARFANVSGDTFTGTVTAPTFIGALSGNATSATSAVNATFATSAGTASEWTTARSIILAGDATGSVSINGSANVTLTVAVVDNSHAHTIANVTGLQAALDSKLALTGGTMSGSLTIGTIVGNAVGSILNVTGNIVATGDVTAYSDRSLKDNIVTIDSALDKVSALRGVYFDKDGKASTGVIAQEVEEVLPEVVHTQENGLKSVAYGNMVGLLIEAVKELTEQNKQMAAEIARLNDRLNN